MRKQLLLSTALLAMSAGQAMAFENLSWSWDKQIRQYEKIIGKTSFDFFPSGNVEVEKLQIFIGTLDSNASLGTFVNNQPTAGGEVSLSTTLNIQGTWDANKTNSNLTPTSQTFDPDVGLSATVDTTASKINVSPTQYDITLNLTGTVSVPSSQTFDAVTQLPEVNVSATSVANIDQITSSVATYVHEGQFVFNTNGQGELDTSLPSGGNSLPSGGNQFHTGAALAALAAINGDISPAQINATATAGSITNASANVSATAIANLASIDVAPTYDPVALDGFTPAVPRSSENNWHGTPASYPVATDLQLIGDVTQFAYANVRATASLGAMELNNYTNLRQLPAVGGADVAGVTVGVANVTASALGNVATINVGVKK